MEPVPQRTKTRTSQRPLPKGPREIIVIDDDDPLPPPPPPRVQTEAEKYYESVSKLFQFEKTGEGDAQAALEIALHAEKGGIIQVFDTVMRMLAEKNRSSDEDVIFSYLKEKKLKISTDIEQFGTIEPVVLKAISEARTEMTRKKSKPKLFAKNQPDNSSYVLDKWRRSRETIQNLTKDPNKYHEKIRIFESLNNNRIFWQKVVQKIGVSTKLAAGEFNAILNEIADLGSSEEDKERFLVLKEKIEAEMNAHPLSDESNTRGFQALERRYKKAIKLLEKVRYENYPDPGEKEVDEYLKRWYYKSNKQQKYRFLPKDYEKLFPPNSELTFQEMKMMLRAEFATKNFEPHILIDIESLPEIWQPVFKELHKQVQRAIKKDRTIQIGEITATYTQSQSKDLLSNFDYLNKFLIKELLRHREMNKEIEKCKEILHALNMTRDGRKISGSLDDKYSELFEQTTLKLIDLKEESSQLKDQITVLERMVFLETLHRAWEAGRFAE